jgi:hypothetical protein
MKINIGTFLILILSTTGFAQKLQFEDYNLSENCPDKQLLNSATIENDLTVIGKINPFYLQSDFDGDGLVDLAVFIEDAKTRKQGILIIHSKTRKSYQLGAGIDFGNGGDDWTWMDVWKIYSQETADKTIFSSDQDIAGKETITLKNIGIEVAASESTSNVITWDGRKYIWIHTGD